MESVDYSHTACTFACTFAHASRGSGTTGPEYNQVDRLDGRFYYFTEKRTLARARGGVGGVLEEGRFCSLVDDHRKSSSVFPEASLQFDFLVYVF